MPGYVTICSQVFVCLVFVVVYLQFTDLASCAFVRINKLFVRERFLCRLTLITNDQLEKRRVIFF